MSRADFVSTRPLPPGLSESEFAGAIDAFSSALGPDKRLTSDDDPARVPRPLPARDVLDPNGILSPGKQGIWPKHMRNGR